MPLHLFAVVRAAAVQRMIINGSSLFLYLRRMEF
jgi:hypothetical protein